MTVSPLLKAPCPRRSPASLPGYLAGRPPRNKGLRYPPDLPTVEEIVAVMRPPPSPSVAPVLPASKSRTVKPRLSSSKAKARITSVETPAFAREARVEHCPA